MGRDGSWNAVPEDHEEEENEGDDELDGEEVCEDEVFEEESPADWRVSLDLGLFDENGRSGWA